MLPRKRSSILKDLDRVTVDLTALLRGRLSLSDAEQLFIENRLMILQIEYSLWAKDKLKEKKKPDGRTKKDVD